ncbi:MAG: SdrD B-like domain-containing protein, partial [Aphanizomenon gracile PMC649.10]|nr:SdrD B-like domain-containing protein [Aphanizomenon gracile PMC649.10]
MILNWVLHKKYQRTRYINDPNLSNNSITQEIRVFDSGLALEISSDKTEVGIGPNHQATFTFNIKNFGDDWATGSQLSILIPKGINLLNSSMLGRSEQDSEGNTILTIDTGIIVDTKSVNITVEATGYSQPLDKLYDYLWDVNVYGKVTWDQDTQAPTLESKTIRVDSSKGIAEELVKSFLFGSASNQPNSLKTLTAFQKVTTSSEIVEGFMQIGDEYVNDLGTAVTSPIEKIFNTAGDTFSEQTKALKELNLKKGIEATQAGVKNTEQQVNQFPDNVKQGVEKARDKALIKGVGLLVDSATEEVFGPFISGSYQALKLASLSYSDGVVNYQKETNTDKVNLGVTVGKNEEVPQAILQSALAGNTSQIESWANSTVNNFTAQGSYSKTLPNGQVGLNYGYSNATKTLSYGIETSLSLGNGFRLGGKVEGQFGQGQPLPTAFLSVTYTEPEPKNPPQGDRSVSPQSYTNNLEKNFQSILAFADSTFSEPANLSQSIQSLTNGNDNSSTAILDKSGRFLVFTSEASNLIEGDTNGVTDVFIRDIQTKTLERISLSNDGTEANGKSEGFAISADGRYVVFASNASNLIANDSNNTQDIFLRDRITNTTQRVSLANDSSQTNGASDLAAISANGRYIVFSSIASNLVAGDTNEMVDVFVRDLEAGTTELISAASNNSQSNNDSLSPDAAISEDGRYVVFYSYASNLVANDTNEVADIFVRDRQTGLTVRVSAANDGAEGNDISLSPVISADGRYVAFSSLASNLVAGDTNGTGDIFVYDQQTKTIERVSLASDGTEADSNSSRPSISSDGRYVVFQSRASNFGVDNPDFYSNIYLRDRLTRETKLVSPSLNGETDGDSINPSISADGSYIAFESAATNLVDGDTNGTSDIFVYTLSASETSDAEINGIVWNDINGDSIKGSSEPTLTGWTIYLDSNNNNLLDAGETSTLSDSQGAYKFSNLSPNSYTVAQIIQDSYKQTYPVINVTTTASTEEIFTPSDSLSITSTTQNTNATK